MKKLRWWIDLIVVIFLIVAILAFLKYVGVPLP